jgi:lipid-binding SYLF domain-containing protein
MPSIAARCAAGRRTFTRRRFVISAGAACLPLAACTDGTAANPQRLADAAQRTVDRSAQTLQTLTGGAAPQVADALGRARAVMVFPDSGAAFASSRGLGVLLAHPPDGWSDPAFYASDAMALSMSLGITRNAVVMFVMSQTALDALLQPRPLRLSATAGLTLADLDRATDEQAAGADLLVWSEAGAGGGVALAGSVITPRLDDDQAYYGRAAGARDITSAKGQLPAAANLRAALES